MTSSHPNPAHRPDRRAVFARGLRRLVPGAGGIAGVPREALLALVRAYRRLVSPWRPPSCRFEPSCSAYALDALSRHGAAAGSCLAVHRLLRCGPWCEGGFDPVPPHPPRLFRFLSGEPPASTVPTPKSPP